MEDSRKWRESMINLIKVKSSEPGEILLSDENGKPFWAIVASTNDVVYIKEIKEEKP
jgi:hypothetical protein